MWGGQPGVRDREGLAAAVAMPEQTFGGEYLHEYPLGMAAAYAFHIAERQAFFDGNKRTALMAALVFLRLNGFTVDATDPHHFERAMLGFADKSVTKEAFKQFLLEKVGLITKPRGPWINEEDDEDWSDLGRQIGEYQDSVDSAKPGTAPTTDTGQLKSPLKDKP